MECYNRARSFLFYVILWSIGKTVYVNTLNYDDHACEYSVLNILKRQINIH